MSAREGAHHGRSLRPMSASRSPGRTSSAGARCPGRAPPRRRHWAASRTSPRRRRCPVARATSGAGAARRRWGRRAPRARRTGRVPRHRARSRQGPRPRHAPCVPRAGRWPGPAPAAPASAASGRRWPDARRPAPPRCARPSPPARREPSPGPWAEAGPRGGGRSARRRPTAPRGGVGTPPGGFVRRNGRSRPARRGARCPLGPGPAHRAARLARGHHPAASSLRRPWHLRRAGQGEDGDLEGEIQRPEQLEHAESPGIGGKRILGTTCRRFTERACRSSELRQNLCSAGRCAKGSSDDRPHRQTRPPHRSVR
jgi:hypothetical protein